MTSVFDPEVLQGIVRAALDLPLSRRIDRICDEIARHYPTHVRPRPEWIFNVAGGAMGQMRVLHASLTEYVLVFGSPIGTEGYSGRFAANDYFTIIDGEQWCYAEGELERRVYTPGMTNFLPRGQSRGYRMPGACYGLEYARGFIPLMLPFALADSFTSTVDPIPLARTMGLYTKSVLSELLRGKI